MKKAMKKKLSGKSGETIAETLMAVIVFMVAGIMLAEAISASVSMVTKSSAKLDEYYKNSNALVSTAESDMTTGMTVQIAEADGTDLTTQTYDAVYTVNTDLGGVTVVSYVVTNPELMPAAATTDP